MRRTKTMNNFAVSMVTALAPANLLHLGWTVWLTMEQIETGWDGGTGIEMMALALWMTELVCMPTLLVGVVYLVMSFFRQQKKGLLIANIALFIGLLAQIAMTNLFLYY